MKENSFKNMRNLIISFIKNGELPDSFNVENLLFNFSKDTINYLNKTFGEDWTYEKTYASKGKEVEIRFIYKERIFTIKKFINDDKTSAFKIIYSFLDE